MPEDLFPVAVGEVFDLELSLLADACARDPLDRFALVLLARRRSSPRSEAR